MSYHIDFKYRFGNNGNNDHNGINVLTYLCHPRSPYCHKYDIDTILNQYSDILNCFLREYDMGKISKKDVITLIIYPCYYLHNLDHMNDLFTLLEHLHATHQFQDFIKLFDNVEILYINKNQKDFVNRLLTYFTKNSVSVSFVIERCDDYSSSEPCNDCDHEYIEKNKALLELDIEEFKH